MPGHLPALQDARFHPLLSYGKIGGRLPQPSGPLSFTVQSTVVTELPVPHPSVPPPQLHLPPLIPA